MSKKVIKHPCIGCVYFVACGDSSRTAPCQGRKTVRERKREQK